MDVRPAVGLLGLALMRCGPMECLFVLQAIAHNDTTGKAPCQKVMCKLKIHHYLNQQFLEV